MPFHTFSISSKGLLLNCARAFFTKELDTPILSPPRMIFIKAHR